MTLLRSSPCEAMILSMSPSRSSLWVGLFMMRPEAESSTNAVMTARAGSGATIAAVSWAAGRADLVLAADTPSIYTEHLPMFYAQYRQAKIIGVKKIMHRYINILIGDII